VIAKEVGLDVRQVRRFQRSENLPIPTNALPQDVVEKIHELTAKGMPQNKIASRLEIHTMTVAKYRRRNELR
jgi:hypothetical protein